MHLRLATGQGGSYIAIVLFSISILKSKADMRLHASGDNLFKNRSLESTSEYKQLPINWRLFENTVKLPNKFLHERRNLKLKNRYQIL